MMVQIQCGVYWIKINEINDHGQDDIDEEVELDSYKPLLHNNDTFVPLQNNELFDPNEMPIHRQKFCIRVITG